MSAPLCGEPGYTHCPDCGADKRSRHSVDCSKRPTQPLQDAPREEVTMTAALQPPIARDDVVYMVKVAFENNVIDGKAWRWFTDHIEGIPESPLPGCSAACQGTWPTEPGQPQKPFHTRSCPNRPDRTPTVQRGYGKGWSLVQGECPACGARSLFLGSGGYVTCAGPTCGNPSAASHTLDPYWDEPSKENP